MRCPPLEWRNTARGAGRDLFWRLYAGTTMLAAVGIDYGVWRADDPSARWRPRALVPGVTFFKNESTLDEAKTVAEAAVRAWFEALPDPT